MWCFKLCIVSLCISSVLAESIDRLTVRVHNPSKFKHRPNPKHKNYAEIFRSKNIKSEKNYATTNTNKKHALRQRITKPTVDLIYVNIPNWLPNYEFRTIKPEWKKNGDCLYKTRTAVRPYPNDCYKHSNYSQESFHAFWKTIRGVLSYTFDTVLWNHKNSNEDDFKTNQFWYLIAYLKQMAIKFQSPDQIGAISTKKSVFNFRDVDSMISFHFESITTYRLHAQDQTRYISLLKQKEETNLRARENKKIETSVKSQGTSNKSSLRKGEKLESAFVWKKTSLKKAFKLIDNAVVIGRDTDGTPLWVIRAHMDDDDLNIGKFNLNRTIATVPNEGNEVIVKDDFEVLCKKTNNPIKWAKYNMSDPFPKNAMLAGEVGLSTKMYVGRIKLDGHYVPGKIIKEVLYIPYQGQEYHYNDDFDVLVESQVEPKKPSTKGFTFKSEGPAFVWKRTCVKHAYKLRDKAVVGGKDHDGVLLWVIRAQLEDEDLTLGKFNPNRSYASVPKDGHEVLVPDYFDVLCKMNKHGLHWMSYRMSEEWPTGAVLVSEMENGSKVYVGRIKQEGLHTHGKIINKVLYVTHQGHELQYNSDFEVLVESQGDFDKPRNKNLKFFESGFIWKRSCLKHAQKLTDKAAVGGKDHNRTPLWIIRAQLDDDDLNVGTFNPSSNFASVPKDGSELLVKKSFDVLCKKNNDNLDWIKYNNNMSANWPEDAVLAGEMNNSTKIYVGRALQNGFETPGKIVNKVLYVAYQGKEYRFENDFEILVESHGGGSEKPSKKPEDNLKAAYVWKKTCLEKADKLSGKAVVGGFDHDEVPLWIIRAKLEDDGVNLGIYNPSRNYASVPQEGHEVLVHHSFDVLCEKKKNALVWLNHKKSDPWPDDAVSAGEVDNSVKMFVGRIQQDGHYIPGKIINEMLQIAYQGLEYKYDDDFEILVQSNDSPKNPVHEPEIDEKPEKDNKPEKDDNPEKDDKAEKEKKLVNRVNSEKEEKSEIFESHVTWKTITPENSSLVKEDAVVGGEDFSGNILLIIRSLKDNDVNVGKFNPNSSYGTAAKDGAEVSIEDHFDVLCGQGNDSVKWIMRNNPVNPIPKYAVIAGKLNNSKLVFVGRFNMEGHYTPGKIIDKVLYISYQGTEFQYNKTYEILVENVTRSASTRSQSVKRTTTKNPKTLVMDDDDDDDDSYEDEYFQAV